MALPTLDATFASSADLPRKQMLAKWLVEELGETQAPSNVLVSGAGSEVNGTYTYRGEDSGKPYYSLVGEPDNTQNYSIWWEGTEWEIYRDGTLEYYSTDDVEFPWLATTWVAFEGVPPLPMVTEISQPSPPSNYYDLPERYLWAKIAVAAGAPREEAAYISLPKNCAWSDIYNAVAGSSGNHTDWSENVALGHIAAAYRGDTGNPANLATYIDWPWRYKVASIIGGIAPSGPTFPSDGLFAFWKLDNVNDSSANGLTLTNNNTVTFGSGKIGNAAQFDGTNSLTVLNPDTNVINTKSFSFWVKRTTSTTSQQGLICGLIAGYYIHTQNDKLGFWNGSAPDNFESIATLPVNDWAHCVVIYDNPTLKFYIDGTFDSEINAGGNASIAQYNNICLGAARQNQIHFTGELDAVGIWNRVLTEEEITTLYNNGSGLEPS